MRAWMIFGLSICLTGCIGNVPYRLNAPNSSKSVLHEVDPKTGLDYRLCFIEFDDMGEMFQREQLDDALKAIGCAKKEDPYGFVEVVVFVHGWKNNASDKSGNVWGFRESLQGIAQTFNDPSLHKRVKPVPLVGVYVGWRGGAVSLPVLKEFTFWDRQRAANRVPHPSLTEVLYRIMIATKGPDFSENAVCILIGHSFGGLILERALAQWLEGVILRGQSRNAPQESEQRRAKDQLDRRMHTRSTCAAPSSPGIPRKGLPADLIVFLNEAGPATEGKQLIEFLKANDIHVTTQDQENAHVTEHPLIVSVTSTGDLATKLAFPGGQALSRPFHRLRSYPPDDVWAGDTRKQSHFYLQTTANMKALQSHVLVQTGVCKSDCFHGSCPDGSLVPNQASGAQCRYASVCVDRKVFDVIRIEDRPNDTPYWVMQMPADFVPDHSTVFRPELRDLLYALMRPAMAAQFKEDLEKQKASRKE